MIKDGANIRRVHMITNIWEIYNINYKFLMRMLYTK